MEKQGKRIWFSSREVGPAGAGLGLPASAVAGPELVPLPGPAQRILRPVLHGGRAGHSGRPARPKGDGTNS